MFIVSISWLVSTFFTWSPALSPTYRREGVTISIITWGIFALDLSIRFVLDPKKRNFVKRSWPLMIALLFPPLRILLVITAVMRVARDRNALAKIVGLYAVYAVTFVVLFGALFTLIFEIDAAGANIKTFGDATWWAFVTVTTVGYGDFTPVTIGGRVIAVLIMFTGAAAVGAVTAAVASRFINASNSSSASSSSQEPQESQSSTDPHPSPSIGPVPSREEPRLEDVMNYLRTMEEQVKHIAERLDQPSATRGTAGE
jgi:voltage-gated potassium channel